METNKPGDTVELSVIIVSWNVLNFLEPCIESIIRNSSSLSLEIIVVDNASTDGTIEWLERSYPELLLIKNKVNKGFAAACNQGFHSAQGNYILFLNPDTVIMENCLTESISFLDSTPDCGLLGCRLLNPDHSLQPSIRKFLTNYNLVMEHVTRILPDHSKLRQTYDYTVFPHDRIENIDWLIGAFMMLRREDLIKIGGFDEDYHLYHEDTDICYRIHKTGKQVIYFPHTSIIHYGNQSGIQRFGDRTILQYYAAKHRFLDKHYARPVLWLHRMLMFVLLSWRLGISFLSDPRQKKTDRKFLLLGMGIQLGIVSSD